MLETNVPTKGCTQGHHELAVGLCFYELSRLKYISICSVSYIGIIGRPYQLEVLCELLADEFVVFVSYFLEGMQNNCNEEAEEDHDNQYCKREKEQGCKKLISAPHRVHYILMTSEYHLLPLLM